MAACMWFLFIISLLGLVHKAVLVEQCNGPRQLPIWGKMLTGHIYDKRSTRSGYAECLHVCRNEDVCESFNFIISESACELNNRTKEACPSEDFVPDQDRYYVKLDVTRVPLGSMRELPAKSCQEINANEGRKMPSNKYWFYSLIPGNSVLAYCDMTNEDIDECSAVPPVCTNGVCKNSVGSHDCSCYVGFTGNGKTCSDIDECADKSDDCDDNADCTNNQGSYSCACKPSYYGDGKSCINTIHLNESTILSNKIKYRVQLTTYLAPVVQSSVRSRFVRCWHAKTDGWAASTFHSNCDGKGPTVTIIQVGSYIFGGYSDLSWYSSSCDYANSSKAFIFSLYNVNGSRQSRYNPVKLEVKPRQERHAVYKCARYGPTFGHGHEIYISNNAASNQHSYTHCDHSYPLPPGYFKSHSQCTFYAGSYYFTPTDIEVFYETTT